MSTNFNKPLNSYANLFKSGQEIAANENETTSSEFTNDIELNKLKPFSKHPFKAHSSQKLKDLADSIAKNGVLFPIIVRPIQDERYSFEIIAGHNRVNACWLIDKNSIPCIIKDVDDATATIMMVDTNLQQRETILPSEKAFAYKYKFDAVKAKGKRNDLTSSQHATRLQADELIASESNESKDTMYRYIRLTHLIKPILDLVDAKKIAFIPAVEISFLSESEQNDLFDIMKRDESYNIPLKQASLLKNASNTNTLSYRQIDKILSSKSTSSLSNIKISYKKIREFFDSKTSPKEVEKTIIKALDAWFDRNSEVKE